MIKDRAELDLPDYFQLLSGYYEKRGPTYKSWRPSGTDDWLMIATISGAGRFGTPPGEFVSREGNLVLIRPGVVHDYGTDQTTGDWTLLWVHFHPRPHWHEWLEWPGNSKGVMYLQSNSADWQTLLDLFQEVHAHSNSNLPYDIDLAMNALEKFILLCHGKLVDSTTKVEERIAASLAYIDSHLQERIPVEILASNCALSLSRFAHLFRQEVGIPPLQHIELRRIERAKQLLDRTTESIGQIADQVGYSPVQLAHRFRLHTGVSPREYRKLRSNRPEHNKEG